MVNIIIVLHQTELFSDIFVQTVHLFDIPTWSNAFVRVRRGVDLFVRARKVVHWSVHGHSQMFANLCESFARQFIRIFRRPWWGTDSLTMPTLK